MTTPNQMSLKNFVNGMLFGVLVVLLMLVTVGCDKKKSSNANSPFQCPPGQFCGYPGQPGQPGIPGQPGFGGGSGVVGLGYDQNSGSPVFLEFIPQSGQFTNPYYIDGPVFLRGQIDINQAAAQQCGVQPGSYDLQSTQPAYAQSGVVNNAVLSDTYGAGITLQVSYATMQAPTGYMQTTQYLPLMGSMTLYTYNGYPCYLSVQP